MRGRAVDKPFHLLVPRASACLTLCGRRSWWTPVAGLWLCWFADYVRDVDALGRARKDSGLSVGRPVPAGAVGSGGGTPVLPAAFRSLSHHTHTWAKAWAGLLLGGGGGVPGHMAILGEAGGRGGSFSCSHRSIVPAGGGEGLLAVMEAA